MSHPITNEIADQLVGLKRVHGELEGAIDASLRPVWQLNDGLLTWLSLLSESDDNYTETANHFMAISVWLERALFGHRNKPLCSKGVYKELTLLEEVIEDRAHNYVRSDVDSQQVMLNASLSVILLASGSANATLVDFADKVERLLEQDLTPLYIELVFPDRLIPSMSVVVAHVREKVVDDRDNASQEGKNPETGEAIDPIDAEFNLPDLEDF
ncbi:hypothetical protein N9260_01535 [bacterium]|nr:hypothetical protein [bacterium]